MDEPILAIDFGMSVSSVFLVTAERPPEPLNQKLSSTEPWWRSAVRLANGSLQVGEDAWSRRTITPRSYRDEFKRAFGDPTPMLLGGQEYTAFQLVMQMLKAMRQRAAEEVPGRTVRRALLTVPPGYLEPGDLRAELMVRAGLEAGFEMVELLPEPVAAALDTPVDGPFADGDLVLIYDFGGGTFDAALVTVGATVTDRRIPAVSLDRCGGTDIDASIAHWLLNGGSPELADQIPEKRRTGEDPEALSALMSLAACCDALKCGASEESPGETKFRDEIPLTLPLDRLNALAEPWVEMTVRCCLDLLATAGAAAGSLAGILLVGGSSQLYCVRTELKRAFPGVPLRSPRAPRLAVVRGAAEFATQASARELGQGPAEVGVGPLRWPIPGDTGRLLRWHVRQGDSFEADTVLAEVRLPLGPVYRLRAAEAGSVTALHAGPGQLVRAKDWLLTTARPFSPWQSGKGITDSAKISGVTPVTWHRSVITSTETGVVEARATATGALRWRQYVGEVTGLAVADESAGLITVRCQGTRDHILSAQTGTEPSPAGDRQFSDQTLSTLPTPVRQADHEFKIGQFTVDGGVVYACCGDNVLRKLDAATGAVLVQEPREEPAAERPARARDLGARVLSAASRMVPEPLRIGALFSTPPVLSRDGGTVPTVYVGTKDGRVLAFAAGTLTPRGEEPVAAEEITGLAVSDGIVFVITAAGRLHAMDAATGWRPPPAGR